MQQLATPLLLRGVVVKGFGRGSRELGIPTANLDTEALEAAGALAGVAAGIYAGWATVRQAPDAAEPAAVHKMVMSIGWCVRKKRPRHTDAERARAGARRISTLPFPPSPRSAMAERFPDPNPTGPEPRRPFPYPQNPLPTDANAGAFQNLYVYADRMSQWPRKQRQLAIAGAVCAFGVAAFSTWASLAKDSAWRAVASF